MAHHMGYRSAMADRHKNSRPITLRLPHALADSVEAGAAVTGLSRNAFVAQLLERGAEMHTCTPGYLVYNAWRGAGASHEDALYAVRRMNEPEALGADGTATVEVPLLATTVADSTRTASGR